MTDSQANRTDGPEPKSHFVTTSYLTVVAHLFQVKKPVLGVCSEQAVSREGASGSGRGQGQSDQRHPGLPPAHTLPFTAAGLGGGGFARLQPGITGRVRGCLHHMTQVLVFW